MPSSAVSRPRKQDPRTRRLLRRRSTRRNRSQQEARHQVECAQGWLSPQPVVLRRVCYGYGIISLKARKAPVAEPNRHENRPRFSRHLPGKAGFLGHERAQGEASRSQGDRFVVQKHDARRLHYDLRLELDGVLKSWAVTRGPSLVHGEKRLSVHTEDHPLQYIDFEGVIPAGQYGGGTMIVWDQGRWVPESDPHARLRTGSVDVHSRR